MNVDPRLTNKEVQIAIIGCGGTGSHIIQELPRFHMAKTSEGHPGLQVTVFDPARVNDINVVRQRYFSSEVGKHKCEVLIKNRINPTYVRYGLRWLYRPHKWGSSPRPDYDIIVSCVDTKESRKAINKSLRDHQYIIDCGNGPDFGQVLVGGPNLGNPYEDHPELLKGREDNSPSCSFMQSITRQGLVTNMVVAAFALNFLEDILVKGRVNERKCFINLNTKKVK